MVHLNNVVFATLSDYSLFTYSSSEVFLYVLVYVDDLVVIGNDMNALQNFKAHLSTYFPMKGLRPLKCFLGIEVAQNNQGIYLCQRKYALDILTDASFLGTKSICFLMEQNHLLGKAKGPLLTYPDSHTRLLG